MRKSSHVDGSDLQIKKSLAEIQFFDVKVIKFILRDIKKRVALAFIKASLQVFSQSIDYLCLVLIGFDDIITHPPKISKFGNKSIEIVYTFLRISIGDRVMLKIQLKLGAC